MPNNAMDAAPAQLDATAEALFRLGAQRFLEELPIGICCCDAKGIIRRFNRHAVEMWGQTPPDPNQLYSGAYRLYQPDGTPMTRGETPMAIVLQTGEPVRDRRIVMERPDGSRITALVNAEPLWDEAGDQVGAVSCFQDISELTHAREELEGFFENSAIGLHVVNADGIIERANQTELTLLGYAFNEYVGRHIDEIHADAETSAELMDCLRRGEKVENFPARLRAKDGSIRHVLITTSNPTFRDGHFRRSRCFTLDVTSAIQAEERRHQAEQHFRDVLEGLPAAVYTTDARGRVTYFNKAAVELAGRDPQIGGDEWCVTWKLFNPDGTPLPHDQCPMAVALREERQIRGSEAIAERPDGSRVRFQAFPTPLYDHQGRLTGAVNMLVDVTERHKMERHLAAIVASSDDAIISKSLDGTIRSWNAGAERIFGYTADEMIGHQILKIIPPELHEEEFEILARLRRGERIEHFETVRVAKDGRRVDISLTVSPVRGSLGDVVGASKVARDITERKRNEALQQLLIGELNHRVKNTLATVQAIAAQTVRRASSPAEFAVSFNGRLQSLARTHDLLTHSSWAGADLASLVRDQVVLGGPEGGRVALAGPHVFLEPQAALHLALVLHELGTNARKHGALSLPHGRVSLHWEVRTLSDAGAAANRELRLHWQESGGPPVSVPSSHGFGTTLIEKSLGAHGGRATVHYRAEGVACDIRLPISERSGAFAGPAREAVSPTRASGSALHGKRVLVVEDEALIAMDIATTFEDAGATVIGPASTIEQAQALVASTTIDAALLDANLAGNPIDELAEALAARGVPFAFLTGYGRNMLPPAFRHAPLIRKPFMPREATEAVAELLMPSARVISLRPKGHSA